MRSNKILASLTSGDPPPRQKKHSASLLVRLGIHSYGMGAVSITILNSLIDRATKRQPPPPTAPTLETPPASPMTQRHLAVSPLHWVPT